MIYDFHTHTSLSDGNLSPIEMVRRALVKGYQAIALTDHVAIGSLSRVIEELSKDCALARAHWNILAIPGVELTHVPTQAIAETAKKAKALGAWLVVVHGETFIEPVEKGTNLSAVQCPNVDILAHPGFLTPQEMELASANGTFIELSAKQGHRLANEHIALLAQNSTAKLLVNSDAHSDEELLTPASAYTVARNAGLNEELCHQVLTTNPLLLIEKLPTGL